MCVFNYIDERSARDVNMGGVFALVMYIFVEGWPACDLIIWEWWPACELSIGEGFCDCDICILWACCDVSKGVGVHSL